jgi:hypothetical protein
VFSASKRVHDQSRICRRGTQGHVEVIDFNGKARWPGAQPPELGVEFDIIASPHIKCRSSKS